MDREAAGRTGAGAGDQIRFVGYGAGTLLQLDATRWQISSQNGTVTFTTTFPGCYSGRWPHVHFEV